MVSMRILYRDEALAAVEKPAGLPAEPTRDPRRGSALELARRELGLGAEVRIGLPHRLDRDTSGVLVIGLTRAALAELGRAFEERRTRKLYAALVHGRVATDELLVEDHLAAVGERDGIEFHGRVRAGGKKAASRVRVLARGAATTLVEVELLTGRTHQARVHLAGLGHPILGDELYGAPAGEHARLGRYLLHAARLELPHPLRAGETLVLESALPAGFDPRE